MQSVFPGPAHSAIQQTVILAVRIRIADQCLHDECVEELENLDCRPAAGTPNKRETVPGRGAAIGRVLAMRQETERLAEVLLVQPPHAAIGVGAPVVAFDQQVGPYLFDCGVFRGLRPAGPLDRPEEIAGAALEGLVAQHLRAWLAYRNAGERLYYWRTRAGSEVDFIIYGPDQFIAIEVKHSATVRRSDLHALRSFHDDYPEAQRLLLYLGDEQLHVDGVHCMPCERFLRALHPHRNFPLPAASR